MLQRAEALTKKDDKSASQKKADKNAAARKKKEMATAAAAKTASREAEAKKVQQAAPALKKNDCELTNVAQYVTQFFSESCLSGSLLVSYCLLKQD